MTESDIRARMVELLDWTLVFVAGGDADNAGRYATMLAHCVFALMREAASTEGLI